MTRYVGEVTLDLSMWDKGEVTRMLHELKSGNGGEFSRWIATQIEAQCSDHPPMRLIDHKRRSWEKHVLAYFVAKMPSIDQSPQFVKVLTEAMMDGRP